MRTKSALLSSLVGLVISSVAIASPVQGNADRPGDITTIDRTIEVKIGDMFFLPGSVEVKAGETVRFLLGGRKN